MSAQSSLTSVLSKEEIEALLAPEKPVLDLLKHSNRLQKNSTFEKITTTFIQMLGASLKHIVKDEEIIVQNKLFSSAELGEYLNHLPHSGVLGFFQIPDWKQKMLLCFDNALAYSLIDMTLGGTRGTAAYSLTKANYTKIEQDLLSRIFSQLAPSLSQVFGQKFSFETLDTNPKTALIAHPACEILVAHFDISFGDKGGQVEIVLPAFLMQTEEMKNQPMEIPNIPTEEGILSSLMNVSLDLKAVLDCKELSFNEVTRWKKGDIIPLSYVEDKKLSLVCHETPLFKGELLVHKKNISIQIQKVEGENC